MDNSAGAPVKVAEPFTKASMEVVEFLDGSCFHGK